MVVELRCQRVLEERTDDGRAEDSAQFLEGADDTRGDAAELWAQVSGGGGPKTSPSRPAVISSTA